MVLNATFDDVPTVRELIKIKKIRAEWESKTPLQKWSYLYAIGRSALNIMGFPIFRDDSTLYWFSYIFFVYLMIDIILVIYTAFYFLSMGDIGSFVPCTALLVGPLLCVRVFEINSFYFKIHH